MRFYDQNNFKFYLILILSFQLSCTWKKETALVNPTPAPIQTLITSEKALEKAKASEVPFKLYQLSSINPENVQISPIILNSVFGMVDRIHDGKRNDILNQLFNLNADWKKEVPPEGIVLNTFTLKKEKVLTTKIKKQLIELYDAKENTPAGKQKASVILNSSMSFNFAWLFPFRKERTTREPFQVTAYHTEVTATMHQIETIPYAEDEESLWIELPFKNSDLVMDLVLPKKHLNLRSVEERLSPRYFEEKIKSLKPKKVAFKFPQIKIVTQENLKDLLTQAGNSVVFTTDKKTATIDAEQKISVSFDEEGSLPVSSAVTSEEKSSGILPPKKFYGTEPFLYFIRNSKSGTLYLIGRMFNPAGK